MLGPLHAFRKWVFTLALHLLANNSKAEAQSVMIHCLCASKQAGCKGEPPMASTDMSEVSPLVPH